MKRKEIKKSVRWLFISWFFLLMSCFTLPIMTHEISMSDEVCIKPHHKYKYKTCAPLSVQIDDEFITIPANFDTDLASIPKWLWWWNSPAHSSFMSPAVIHDYLYSCPGRLSRKTVDEVFFDCLRKKGVSYITAYRMYYAVRLFGARYYHKNNICIYVDSFDYNKKIEQYTDYLYED